MRTKDAIAWFKTTFGAALDTAVTGTPFTIDMLTAIAYQETGYIWSVLLDKQLSLQKVLELSVGDTIDAPGRSSFPRGKGELIAAPGGQDMFRIARQALVDMAQYIPGYDKVVRNANKFCHGYGIFQYDIQFFKDDPDFFLQKKWGDIACCIGKLLIELRQAMQRQCWSNKATLTDTERVFVAIAYNKGRANPALGFKQGYQSDDGRYYGENVFEFLRIAQTITIGPAPRLAAPVPDTAAPLPPPTPVEAMADVYEVNVRETSLCLRSTPSIDKRNPNGNVIAQLPAGQMVVRVSGKRGDQFFEVETSLNGAHFHGFAASAYLRPVKAPKAIPVATLATPVATPASPVLTSVIPLVTPAVAAPTVGIVAVYMPRRPGTITRRVDPAGPHSLNEPGQPQRSAESAAERCDQLATIIDWLCVDKPAYKRYQPTGGGTTFCNVYAHDYCFLANVYLPRVWWTPGAIEQLAKGETVDPLYEKTIDEQRANDLFRWLRDFGPRFGWRQTGTLTKLQEAANLGGIGIIVARRKIDGKSGHIVAVIPETDDQKARRDSGGEVTSPVQSQAGVNNFRYRVPVNQWWTGAQFADSGFWIHA